LLPFFILLLSLSFDLIRWHYRRVGLLLTPTFAISKIYKNTIKIINKTQLRISLIAWLQSRFLIYKDERKFEKTDIETVIYNSNISSSKQINCYIDQIVEIVNKAIQKGETNTCINGTNAIAEIAKNYLEKRKDNIILIPSPDAMFLASEPDARDVLTPVYEHLMAINSKASRANNETICHKIIESFSVLSIFTANLKSKAFREHSAPITFAPIFYMRQCIKFSQEIGLYDVGFQASKKLLNIAYKAPKNVSPTSIYHPIIDGMSEIVDNLFKSKNFSLVNSVVSDMMEIAFLSIKQEHFQAKYLIKEILDKLYMILPIAIITNSLQKTTLSSDSFSPYDISSNTSISSLISFSTNLIKDKDDKKPWINPYSDFKSINEQIHRHFRIVSENIQFNDSFVLFQIIETLYYIANVYLSVLERNITDNYIQNQELGDQIKWYNAFFWVVFSKAKAINHQRAEHSCDTLAWIGISFYSADNVSVMDNSISNINSIIESFSNFDVAKESFRTADLLQYYHVILIYLNIKNNSVLANKIDLNIQKISEKFSEEEWHRIIEDYEHRKRQIDDELKEYKYYYSMRDMPMHRAIPLLKSIIDESGKTSIEN
jgi:hypothetical protein